MLVLSRRIGEEIDVDGMIVRVLEVRGSAVRIGVIGPPERPVRRGELLPRGERCNGQRLPPGARRAN